MYLTHNDSKSVIDERFIKAKNNKKMTANHSRSYLSCLNKLVDQHNNTSHHLLTKKLVMLIILLWLKKSRSILNFLNLKLMIESELLSIRIFLVKITLTFGQ